MIDNKTIEQARNTDIIAYFESRYGYTFAHRGGAYRCQQHPSLAVKDDRLSWYWHSRGLGGHGILDYLMKAENMPFCEAVEAATGATLTIAPRPRHETGQGQPKMLVLPEKTGIPLRLYDYLCKKRSIDSDIVHTLIQEEKLYEDRRGNVVFIGHDALGAARFASLRGTHSDFRGDCAGSDKRYGFNTVTNAPSESLYIFESPIDLLSHATLANMEYGDKTAWEYDRRLSLAGIGDTALPFFLNQHKAVKKLVFCLDNDAPGRGAAAIMAQKYADKGYTTRIQQPTNKDFNEDLQAHITHVRKERRNRSYSLNADI